MGHWPHFLHGNFCDLCVFFSFFLPLKRFSCKTTLKLSCSSSNEYFMEDWCCLTSSFLSHSSVSFPLPTDNLPIKIKKKKIEKVSLEHHILIPFYCYDHLSLQKWPQKFLQLYRHFCLFIFCLGLRHHFILSWLIDRNSCRKMTSIVKNSPWKSLAHKKLC